MSIIELFAEAKLIDKEETSKLISFNPLFITVFSSLIDESICSFVYESMLSEGIV